MVASASMSMGVSLLGVERDDDGLRVVVTVMVADEDGDGVLMLVYMYGYFNIVGPTLFDREDLRVQLEAAQALGEIIRNTLNVTWGSTAAPTTWIS